MIINPAGWPYVEDEDLVSDWPAASKVAADRFDAFTVQRTATATLTGNRATALPAATHTPIDLTTTELAPPAGSGLLVVAQGGGLAVDVSVPCRIRLDGWVMPSAAGDSWRIPMAPMLRDAAPGQRWGIGALTTGSPQRFQCSYFRNGAVEASRADALLPATWVHTSIFASLTVTRLT